MPLALGANMPIPLSKASPASSFREDTLPALGNYYDRERRLPSQRTS